ncbi:hypothetical protein [Pseudomonas sp. REB1044]|uniref:hypothetical protein n=1 Tax=Pseudomonas sp. REB1044 TaxID=2675224 RepID=UPI00315D9CB4
MTADNTVIQRSSVQVKPGARSIKLTQDPGILDLPEMKISGLIDDVILPVADQDKDLQVVIPNWPESEEDYILVLTWNGQELTGPEAQHQITATEKADPNFEFVLTFLASNWDSVAEGQDVTFTLGYNSIPFPDPDGDPGPTRLLRIDKLPPGGHTPETLAAIEFPRLVEARNRILISDFVADKLPVQIKGYVNQESGDLITVTATDGTQDVTFGPFTVTNSGRYTDAEFELSKLQALPDLAPITFTYEIVDKAGNRSIVSQPRVLELLLKNAPVNPLPTPIVPIFDSEGLILDEHARAGVVVQIPLFPEASVGDQIIVIWGAQRADPAPITTIPTVEPLLEVMLLYNLLILDKQTGSVDVTYELWRSGSLIGKPAAPAVVEVELRVPGGTDPDPETPEHENLKPADIVGGDSGATNELSPEDLKIDATLFISPETVDGNVLFEAGDSLALLWGSQSPHPLDPVTAGEASGAVDLERPVPSALLLAEGSGEVSMSYTVTRPFGAGGETNTSLSPAQTVKVLSGADLPGGGTPLAKPVFTRLNANGAIGRVEAASDLPLRIDAYINMAVGDIVEIYLSADDSTNSRPGKDIPAATDTLAPITVVQKHIDQGYITAEVRRAWAFIVCRGSATPYYTATNPKLTPVTPVKSEANRTPVAVRESGSPTCPIPTR